MNMKWYNIKWFWTLQEKSIYFYLFMYGVHACLCICVQVWGCGYIIAKACVPKPESDFGHQSSLPVYVRQGLLWLVTGYTGDSESFPESSSHYLPPCHVIACIAEACCQAGHFYTSLEIHLYLFLKIIFMTKWYMTLGTVKLKNERDSDIAPTCKYLASPIIEKY